jgi:hypothetical protein
MNLDKWNKFKKAREHFRHITEELSCSLPELKEIQQKLADNRTDRKSVFYTVDTPVVYNSALDDVTIDDEIKLILTADNPGKREQAAENRRYLIGPSGKIADRFFRGNPALGIDFRRNVVILNKTPIHSPRTVELRELCRMEAKTDRRSITTALEESQKAMASLLLEFQEALCVQVWITGYSEMRKGGIFEAYVSKLKNIYMDKEQLYKQIFIYRHFSMNQFTIDLKQQTLPGESLSKSLKRIGKAYREKVLNN